MFFFLGFFFEFNLFGGFYNFFNVKTEMRYLWLHLAFFFPFLSLTSLRMCFHSPRSFSVSSPLYLSIVPPPDRGGWGTDDHNQFHLFRLFIFTVLVTFDIRPVPFLALHLFRPETDNKFWKKGWLTIFDCFGLQYLWLKTNAFRLDNRKRDTNRRFFFYISD